ncbi:MAG: hypothetical protein Q8934_23640 [Bacillota bacterium]|nr:hypothetical protein [Bacillota bacterium]
MIVPILSLLLYHSVNIFTDTKYRITKNKWHLLFLIIGSAYFFYNHKDWLSYIFLLLISLAFGLLLETLRVSSAGDTKMCIVSIIWVGSISFYSPYITTLVLFVGYILFIFLLSYFKLVKKLGFKWVILNQWYDLKSFIIKTPLSQETALENFPGAVAICFGVAVSILYVVS